MTREAKSFNEKYNLKISDRNFEFVNHDDYIMNDLGGKVKKNWKESLKRFFLNPIYTISLIIFISLIIIAFVVKFSSAYSDSESVLGTSFINDHWIKDLPASGKTIVSSYSGEDIAKLNNAGIHFEVINTAGNLVVIKWKPWDYVNYIGNMNGFDEFHSLLGTDSSGRDFWTRTWSGTYHSLFIAISVALITTITGSLLGSFVGMYPGSLFDIFFMKILALYNSIPTVVWYAIILGFFAPGMTALFVVLIVTGWQRGFGISRMYMWKYINSGFMESAETMGVSRFKRIVKHALPNYLGMVAYSFVGSIPSIIEATASIVFLGFALNPTAADLGNTLNEIIALSNSPHSNWLKIVTPVIIIFTITISLHFCAIGINDALDPRYRKAKKIMSDKILKIKDLNVSFKNKKNMVNIIRGLDLTLHKGEIIGLVGESGSGKSVTSKSFLNVNENAIVDMESLNILGDTFDDYKKIKWGKIRGKQISYIPQNPHTSLNPSRKIYKQILDVIKETKDAFIKTNLNLSSFTEKKSTLNILKDKSRPFNPKNTLANISKFHKECKLERLKINKTRKAVSTFAVIKGYSKYDNPPKKDCVIKSFVSYLRWMKQQKNDWKKEIAPHSLLKEIKKNNNLSNKKTLLEIIKNNNLQSRKQKLEWKKIKNDISLYSVIKKNKELAKKEKENWIKTKTKYIFHIQLLRHRNHLMKNARLETIREIFKSFNIVDIERVMNAYPHELSGGLKQRVIIAMTILTGAQIIIADEPTTALDATVQSSVLRLLYDTIKKYQLSMIFISHNIGVIAKLCDYVYVMYAGRVVERADKYDLFTDPVHPYTWALMLSIPEGTNKNQKELYSIPGKPVDMTNLPVGDPFASRNPYAIKLDFKKEPPLFKYQKDHWAATWMLHPSYPKFEKPKELIDKIKQLRKALKPSEKHE